jgi:ABC-type uncharacterized transport system permease subunit
MFARRRLLMMLVAVLFVACSKAPTEVLLRQTIDQMQLDAEAGRLDALMRAVSQRFSAQGETMDRDAFKRYLLGVVLQSKNIGITRPKTQVTLQQDAGIVEMTLLLTDGGRVLPSDGRLINVRTLWRFEDDRWQLIQADWE